MLTVAAAALPALLRTEKTVPVSGHSSTGRSQVLSRWDSVPPTMAAQIDFRPEALAAAMARTQTLRAAPDAMLTHWARAQFTDVDRLP